MDSNEEFAMPNDPPRRRHRRVATIVEIEDPQEESESFADRFREIEDPQEKSESFVDHFREVSESIDRNDVYERRFSYMFIILALCAAAALVFARRTVLSRMEPAVEVAVDRGRDRFLLLEPGRSTKLGGCVRPTDAEARTWMLDGRACADGACLEIGDMVETLKRAAALDSDGEAYSVQGRTVLGAPIPCAWVWRDENNVSVAYIDPRSIGREGPYYRVRVELSRVFEPRVLRFEAPHVLEVDRLAWPDGAGARVRERVEKLEAVRWTAALVVLDGPES